MTATPQQNQAQPAVENKPNDKELNFRALEARYQKQLEQVNAEKDRLMKELQTRQNVKSDDDDEDNEPYVDHKKLDKKLNKFGQTTQSDIQKAMEIAKASAKEEIKQEVWLENNPDFYETLNNADKFAQKCPRLAESILRMPEGFERQKLVYENIKTLGLDKPEQKASSIQDKIDANKRSPYYQPSGMGTAPYNAGSGDFSESGQKNAYAKLQELKKNLRI